MTYRSILLLGLAACGCGSPRSQPTPPPAPPSEASGAEGQPEPTAAEYMHRHFDLVAAARDAVIRGDPAAVHAPMQKLYDGEYGIEVPQDWMSSLGDMQREAKRGIEVKTLAEAGRTVGMVSRQCGECHRAFGRPKQIAEAQEYEASGVGVKEAMALHKWAAEQMWLGITTPSHEAWIRGSNAISETWSPSAAGQDATATTVDPEVERLIDAIRARGPALREAQTSLARAEAYGALIADCGGCHVASGIQLPR